MSIFSTAPHVLSDAVRNVVVARAVAGLYDPHETEAKAIDGARAAARRRLGQKRLTHLQAVEVDALVYQARARLVQGQAGVFNATALVSETPQPSRDTSLILAALAHLTQLVAAVLALLLRRSDRETILESAPEPQFLPAPRPFTFTAPALPATSALARRGDLS